MTWVTRYQPPNPSVWTGRADAPDKSCFFQIIRPLPLTSNISQYAASNIAFALLGFCCDEGIKRNMGRTGAAEGPPMIRQMLAKLPIQRPNVMCYDAGDITCSDGDLESSQYALGEAVALILKNGITPIVLGGGHELAWGHYQGIAKYLSHSALTIVNFDAHFDMRPMLPNHKGSSGTPFLQIANAQAEAKLAFDYHCIGIQQTGNTYALFETAKQHQVEMLMAEDLQHENKTKCFDFINRMITHRPIYLSLCLDVFASAFAPGVSAPQAMGAAPWQIMSFIKLLAASGKVISYDIAELSPKYDLDQRTAKLAANFIYEIIHHHAVIN